nr:Mov34/MPN/PAD-1 family protein [Candidatus Sigynarchaeota archaeon]
MEGTCIESWIDEFIKSQARCSSKEIYGWLIGYENKNGDVQVISAIACHRYTMQTVIGARPDPKELQELVTSLPTGIGFVGIYHSHPDTIFHSSIDDESLMTYSRFYPKMLSAVTNGTETKWYRHESGTKFTEFAMQQSIFMSHPLHLVKVEAKVNYDVMINPEKPAIPQLTSVIRAGFLASWPGATIEFHVREGGKAKDGSELSPVDNLVAISKENSLGIVEQESIEIVKANHIKDIKDIPMLTRVIVKMPPLQIMDKNLAPVSGTIELDAVLAITTSVTSTVKILDLISEGLIDDLMVKIGRGFFIIQDGFPALVVPASIIIPYINIPLKIGMTSSAKQYNETSNVFKPEFFPLESKFIEMEIQMLDTMLQRALDLGNSGQGTIATKMLDRLFSVAVDREDINFKEKCKNALSLIKK